LPHSHQRQWATQSGNQNYEENSFTESQRQWQQWWVVAEAKRGLLLGMSLTLNVMMLTLS